jgi:hypothetical protein
MRVVVVSIEAWECDNEWLQAAAANTCGNALISRAAVDE